MLSAMKIYPCLSAGSIMLQAKGRKMHLESVSHRNHSTEML